MDTLRTLYPQAVEHTKQKVFADIDSYLETKEETPSFEDYLAERGHYLEQIWINVWLNKSTGKVSKKEKKAFLRDRGFEVEGVDKKIINHLFRTEMRDYQPFDVHTWLIDTLKGNQEEWEDRYHKARIQYHRRAEAEKLAIQKQNVRKEIEHASDKLINNHRELFYLKVRYFTAQHILEVMNTKQRYQPVEDTFALEEQLVEDGPFKVGDFSTVSHFFDELTGEIHKTFHWGQSYYEYEVYYYVYERLINEKLAEIVTDVLVEKLTEDLKTAYAEAFGEELTPDKIKYYIFNRLSELMTDFFTRVQGEYIADLVELAETEFDSVEHKKLYEGHLMNRAKREAEELAEIKRKKEEEARILGDIFGQAYSTNIMGRTRYVLHIGETNTGKTFHALERMKEATSGIYLAPLRLLALEVYDKLNAEGSPCSLKTGEEEKLVPDANHISCTVEMFHEKDFYDVVVIDEAQMITDKDRGFSWYKAITKANANEVHIIGSKNSKNMVLELLGDADIVINEYKRDIPLEVENNEFRMKDVKQADALICFSRRRVLETASILQRNRNSVSMIYGSMPPETRKKQIERFLKGETKVVVATDAIGMGLNLPIRRIVFLENEKFDGTRRRRLTSQEVKQIAGRAGRKGIYDVGKVAFVTDIKMMRRLLEQEDEPVHTFAIAPTNSVFERFQRYYRDLGTFFELWEKFKSPKGTKKAALHEERQLYELIRDTEIEARLPIMELYGYLHLPFSKKEPGLTKQWLRTMEAIIKGEEMPEPEVKNGDLEELELSYKAIGLHLLFLYKLEQRTEAVYWERVREGISDEVHERLKTDVKSFTKKCKNCRKNLPWDHSFPICDACHAAKYRRPRGRGRDYDDFY